jgi:hypothetical protein
VSVSLKPPPLRVIYSTSKTFLVFTLHVTTGELFGGFAVGVTFALSMITVLLAGFSHQSAADMKKCIIVPSDILLCLVQDSPCVGHVYTTTSSVFL